MKKRNLFIVLLMSVMMVFATVGCDELKQSSQENGEQEQEDVMKRARKAVPTPQINNFLTRKAVAKWMERMDTPSYETFIYVMSDSGAFVGYFIAEYRPISTATFLTPTKRIDENGMDQDKVMPSNALDGTYYGEGGAAVQYFWFDAETDALIELKGLNYILSDQPLALDVPQLTVKTTGESPKATN